MVDAVLIERTIRDYVRRFPRPVEPNGLIEGLSIVDLAKEIASALMAPRSEVQSDEPLDATEQGYLEDNIATVAFHLGQPDARLSVSSGLVVDPGEVLKEISRRLTRQAASHGSAGGEPALRAALQEIDEIGRKITDLKNEHGIRMGNIAHAALLGAGTAAQAVPDPIWAALIGINGAIDDYWNDATDSNIKLICYWQFKSREALAEPSASRVTGA